MPARFNKLKRILEFCQSKLYRRVLAVRFLAYLMHKVSPSVKYIGIENEEGKIFLFLKDNVITPYTIAKNHNFQGDEITRAIRICQEKGHSTNGLFIDIGANIGTATLAALNCPLAAFSGAICIEPESNNLNLLKVNINANNLNSKVRFEQKAVGAEKGILKLALSESNHGDHRVYANSNPHGDQAQFIDIEVDTIDHILQTNNVRESEISLVWVDTQGFDGFVLKGAQNLIKNRTPFCIEMSPAMGRMNAGYETALSIIENQCQVFYDLNSLNWNSPQNANTVRNYLSFLEQTDLHTDLLIFPK